MAFSVDSIQANLSVSHPASPVAIPAVIPAAIPAVNPAVNPAANPAANPATTPSRSLTRGAESSTLTQPASPPLYEARLHEGKTSPGPDEWRALERRALSFRLRGSGGCIGRPGEQRPV